MEQLPKNFLIAAKNLLVDHGLQPNRKLGLRRAIAQKLLAAYQLGKDGVSLKEEDHHLLARVNRAARRAMGRDSTRPILKPR